MVDRAVTTSISSDATPDELLATIFGARDDAAESAAESAASAVRAKQSEANTKASEVIAEDARGRACQCADRAEMARDVALQQTETVNDLMATELAKVNAIIAANKDDQQAAVDSARKWAEGAPGVPVDADADGNPEYSARHWANEAKEISIPVMSATARGSARLGKGLTITDGDAQRRIEILSRFSQIYVDSIRPLRALSRGEATGDDKNKLGALDAEAESLRAELAILNNSK